MSEGDAAPRIEVWEAMAAHFLDTETRHDIPLTALACVRAGLSPRAAAEVWWDEVAPALAGNLWSTTGEWAGWDRDWLAAHIEQVRSRRPGPRRILDWLSSRVAGGASRGVWRSIEGTIVVLLRCEPERREQLGRDLAALARHYFDFSPRELGEHDAAARSRLPSLYPEPLRRILAPALLSGEAELADARVRAALSRA